MALERSLESFCWSMNTEYLLFFIVRTIYSWIFVLCSAFLYEVLAFGVRFTGFCLPLWWFLHLLKLWCRFVRGDFGRAYKPIIRSTILPAIRLEEDFSTTVNVVEFPHVAPFEKAKEISHTESSPHLGRCSLLFQYWWYLKKLWHVTPCKFHLIVQ
jgi:hypothetical protein